MPFKYPSMEERIIANTVLSQRSWFEGTRCWEWIGAYKVNRNGMRYPKMSVRISRGKNKGRLKTVSVHRYVLIVFKGRAMLRRQVAMHKCNNSICVNPEHIAGGTQRRNVRQCVADGRHRNGSSK